MINRQKNFFQKLTNGRIFQNMTQYQSKLELNSKKKNRPHEESKLRSRAKIILNHNIIIHMFTTPKSHQRIELNPTFGSNWNNNSIKQT